ncbi:hypothetical protein D3OALGA1CA_4642 [Olavius algarvensis associated proteobacterium Delta 3]|nr:hypothetical protein D3OALGB2SA_4831 [Olavius algarvensis associated proteobacterium Delta 3]CAB5154626.1 hypothetical protein D3OALGA1CA_4642 [Olavius algarvensis associated proteobacterium Delta 3]
MLFWAAVISCLACIFLLLISAAGGILTTLMLKPVIDTAWNNYFAGTNLLRIIGVVVPLIVFPRIIMTHGRNVIKWPLAGVGIFYFFANVLGIMGLIASGNFAASTSIFFRVLNGTLGFFMLQSYFSDKDSFRRLLLCMLIAGLFPVAVGIFQASTGIVWQQRETVGLSRNVGFYHDAFNIRAYGYQTLTAILLIGAYYCRQRRVLKMTVLFAYGLCCCFVIFKSYSKAAVVIFIIWAILWSLFNRKMLWMVMGLILLVAVNFGTGNRIVSEVETLFSKEIGAYEGTVDDRYVLAGRTILWTQYWEEWRKMNMFAKIFGSGLNPPVHNEYLRLLYCNGIVGVVVYIGLLGVIGFQVIRNVFIRRTPLTIMGMMIYSMWLVDTIGLHPGLYPSYQWYVWGFITLALRGVNGIDTEPRRLKEPDYWKSQTAAPAAVHRWPTA